MTPSIPHQSTWERMLCCVADSLFISSLSSLLLILSTQTSFGHSLASIFPFSLHVSYSRQLLSFFLLSLFRSLSDSVLRSTLSQDLLLIEAAPAGNSPFPAVSVLRQLTHHLTQPIGINACGQTARANEEDVIYLVYPAVMELKLLYGEWRECECSDPSSSVSDWKQKYRQLECRYRAISEMIESYRHGRVII